MRPGGHGQIRTRTSAGPEHLTPEHLTPEHPNTCILKRASSRDRQACGPHGLASIAPRRRGRGAIEAGTRISSIELSAPPSSATPDCRRRRPRRRS